MHGPFEKAPEGKPNVYQSWSMKLVAIPLLLLIALIGYIVSHPDVTKWVADGVGAEFAGIPGVPESAPPAQIGQPDNRTRAVAAPETIT